MRSWGKSGTLQAGYSSNKEMIASFQISESPKHMSSSIATFLDFFSLEIDLFTLRHGQLNKINLVGIFMCKKKKVYLVSQEKVSSWIMILVFGTKNQGDSKLAFHYTHMSF